MKIHRKKIIILFFLSIVFENMSRISSDSNIHFYNANNMFFKHLKIILILCFRIIDTIIIDYLLFLSFRRFRYYRFYFLFETIYNQ